MMDFVKIGIISGTSGLNGEIQIRISEEYMRFLKKGHFIFIELNTNSFIPFQITQFHKIDQGSAILSFDEYTSIEEAKQINGKSLYLEKVQIPESQQKFVGTHLIDFELSDIHIGVLGRITNLFELPGQLMAVIIYKGKEVMIPLNDDFIRNIDPKQKKIVLSLPDGLLDI